MKPLTATALALLIALAMLSGPAVIASHGHAAAAGYHYNTGFSDLSRLRS